MEMEWRLEIFEDQGTLPEAGIEEFKKRLRLRRLKKLLARADSSNSQKGKNSRRNQCPLDPPPAPNPWGNSQKRKNSRRIQCPLDPLLPPTPGALDTFLELFVLGVLCLVCVVCVNAMLTI